MNLKIINLKTYDIDQSHFQLIYNIFKNGRINIVEHGSYKGHKRLEYDHVTILITNPETRPLSPQLPQGIPSIATDKDIENYFVTYLMDTNLEKNEEYKYSTFIVPQVEKIIKIFKNYGFGTNQAIITVGNDNSIDLVDPPCLKLIHFKILNNRLVTYITHRSNDLWSGYPLNIAGYQLLKEYVALEIGIEPGETIYSCSGMHLYDFQFPFALQRLNNNIPEGSILTKNEIELGEGWLK